MNDMSVHEVLVKARNIQARRTYSWDNGTPARTGPCCPAAAIAEAQGAKSFEDVLDGPAARVLADEFPAVALGQDELSMRVLWEQQRRRARFSTDEIVERFDRAISKTAPVPDLENVLGDEWAMA